VRLRKCVLSFLQKLVWDEMSLMLDGQEFQTEECPSVSIPSWLLCLGFSLVLSHLCVNFDLHAFTKMAFHRRFFRESFMSSVLITTTFEYTATAQKWVIE